MKSPNRTSNCDTSEGPVDLLKFGAGALSGFLGLLQAKIGFLRSLFANTELHQQIGGALKTGVDITRGIVEAKVGVVRAIADVVMNIFKTSNSCGKNRIRLILLIGSRHRRRY